MASSVRDLSLCMVMFFQYDVLIESDDPDPYYFWLKRFGCMDFIQEIVGVGKEDGIRISAKKCFTNTVIVDRIVPENIHRIIGEIALLAC